MMLFLNRTCKKVNKAMIKKILIFNLLIVLLGLNSFSGMTFGANDSRVAVLLVDTDYVMGKIDEGIYGQFLEHINHSVVDGLFAEQIRGQGFEGRDFRTYWESFADNGEVMLEEVNFENGQRSVRLSVNNGTAGIRQGRIYLQENYDYDGSIWLKPEQGSVQVTLRAKDSGVICLPKSLLKQLALNGRKLNYPFHARKQIPRLQLK